MGFHDWRGALKRVSPQQPDGDDTPGVAAAPVALAGAIAAGFDRFMVTLSAHAEVFGVGATVIVGSRVVLASPVTAGRIVPNGALLGIAGVESGRAAPLVGGPPGIELHTVVDELPSGDTGTMLPVPLPTIRVGMVPKAVVGIVVVDDSVVVEDSVVVDCVVVGVMTAIDVETVPDTVDGVATGVAVMEGGGGAGIAGGGGDGTAEPGMVDMNDVAGCADSVSGAVALAVVEVEPAAIVATVEIDGVVPVVAPVANVELTGTAGVPGAICPVGVEQVTTVPGVVGSEASGTGASVVSGAPG
jgi:hypothetical protein